MDEHQNLRPPALRTTALGFIADSFKWLVEHDRGEPMRAQKAHECYACGRAIPAGEQYRRLRRRRDARINVKVHEGCYQKRRQETPPEPRLKREHDAGAAHHASPRWLRLGTGRHPWCEWLWCRRSTFAGSPTPPELMRADWRPSPTTSTGRNPVPPLVE